MTPRSKEQMRELVPGWEPGEDPDSCGVVHARTAEDVVEIVTKARGSGVRLRARSSAAPHSTVGAGDTEAVVVDLSELRAIQRIDRRNRVLLIEPGVTFDKLVVPLAAAGLQAALPLCPRPGKSALAAWLDREATIVPRRQWDISDPLLCVDAVLGTGDRLRTGSAAGPGTLEEQWAAGEAQKGPMGPGHADWMRLFQAAEGAMGMVVWASVKAEVLPSIETAWVAGADTLAPLVEITYRVLRRNAVDICFLVDRPTLTDLLAVDADRRPSVERSVSAWNLVMSTAGLEILAQRRHDLSVDIVRTEVRAAGARLVDPPPGGRDRLLHILRRPSEGMYWRDRRAGAHRRLYFQTTLDRAGQFVDLAHATVADEGFDRSCLGVYVQPQLAGRQCTVEFLLCHALDEEAASRARSVATALAGRAAAAGAFFSRPLPDVPVPGLVTDATGDFLTRVKAMFDPQCVFSPGALGIGGTD